MVRGRANNLVGSSPERKRGHVGNQKMNRVGKHAKKMGNSHPLAGAKRSLSHFPSKLKSLLTNSYTKFVARKAVFYLIVTFVAMTFVFFIPHLMPGDPIEVMMAHGTAPPGVDVRAVLDRMREYFGFNRPLLDQYISFWGQLLRGDLGPSFQYYPMPAVEIVLSRLGFTLALVLPVLIISFFLGNWMGARAGYLKGKWNEAAYFSMVFSNRMPTFWFGMVLLFLFIGVFHVFSPGYVSLGVIPTLELGVILDVLGHWFLPFLTLMVVYLGGWATGMRSMVTHEMDSGYVRYGEQLGFKNSKLMSYAERNAILPQFTGLNLFLNALIGDTAVIEIIFRWPGVGRLLYDSVGNVDYPLITGSFLIIIVVVILGNFLIDILYGFIDPRIRTGYRR